MSEADKAVALENVKFMRRVLKQRRDAVCVNLRATKEQQRLILLSILKGGAEFAIKVGVFSPENATVLEEILS